MRENDLLVGGMAPRKTPFLFPSMKACTLGILGLLSVPVHAVVVTTAVDEDNGNALGTNGSGVSLREAVKYSSSGASVTFDPALSGALFRMTIAPLAISRSITIDASSLPQPVVLSGDRNNSGGVPDVGDLTVVTIAGGGNVLLNSVVITGGHHTGTGAGIHVSSGELTLRNSTVTGNKGTAIYSLTGPVDIEGCILSNNTAQGGAAVYTTGPLDIRDSTITGNHASGDAGAVFLNGEGPGMIEDCVISGNTAGSSGGAIRSDGDLEVWRCTFLSNAAEADGGAILAGSGELWVETCTFSGNMAEGNGGGIRATTPLIVSKSTLADNSAFNGGAISCDSGVLVSKSTLAENTASSFGGAMDTSGSVSVYRSTVSRNTAQFIGGISIITASNINLSESIVAGNSGEIYPNLPDGFSGEIHITSGNPRLAPLGDYGGPTHTMPPMPGSPAIDAANVMMDLNPDQRGFLPFGTPDIGAAEFQGLTDIALFWKVDPDGDGIPYGVEQATGTDNFTPDSGPLSAPVFPEEGGGLALGFPLAPAAEPGTRWILTRSTDLTSGGFQEIYRFDGTTDTAEAGITFGRTAAGVTVTDTTPPAGTAFYRLEAVLESGP